jgi:ABC-2 type transport system ATP-binding protein
MSAPLIEAINLSKHYGRVAALDSLNFQVQPGRIVGLVGRNGAGKTTLLKAGIDQLRRPTAGAGSRSGHPARRTHAAGLLHR